MYIQFTIGNEEVTYYDGVQYKNQKLSSERNYKVSVAAKVRGVEKLVATLYSAES